MSVPIALRSNFDAAALRGIAKLTKDALQGRSLLVLAAIYDGGSRTDAARISEVGLQTIRDWVLAFNQDGPKELIDGKAPGHAPKLNDAQRQAIVQIVESGPISTIHGVVRWRLRDLACWIFEEFDISLDETTVGRELRNLGYRKLSARPQHHAQNEAARRHLKNFPTELAAIQAQHPPDTAVELWWQDEARVGQKNTITRRWAKRGTQPRAPHDQRTKSPTSSGRSARQRKGSRSCPTLVHHTNHGRTS